MGLFDRKVCDICGGSIGLFGNRKLDNGNMCKDCAAKLSPWLSNRRGMTVEDISAHLAYRESNQALLDSFNETRVVGSTMKIHIDDNQGLLFFTRNSNWRGTNPDVLRFDQITGVNYTIDQTEHRDMAPVGGPGGPEGPEGPGGMGGPGGPRPGGPQGGRPVPPPPGGPRPNGPQPGGPRPGGPQPGGPRPGGPQPGGPRPGGPQPGGPRPGGPQPGGPRPGAPRPNGPQPGRPTPGGPNRGPQGGNRPNQGGHGGGFGGHGSRPMSVPRDPMYMASPEYYTYDFNITVYVNCEWFSEISWQVNTSTVDDYYSTEYANCAAEAEQIKSVLESLQQAVAQDAAAEAEPQQAVTCPCCGATTIPDANGCCEYCGGAVYG